MVAIFELLNLNLSQITVFQCEKSSFRAIINPARFWLTILDNSSSNNGRQAEFGRLPSSQLHNPQQQQQTNSFF
jgi:hypothetical protein